MISWLQREVTPALGCTEPVAIAFAAALAMRYLKEPIVEISGVVSENLYKNAMGVTIPGAGVSGVQFAAALGAFGGDAAQGLQVFKNITSKQVAQARRLIEEGRVSILAKATPDFIHVDLTLRSEVSKCRVISNGGHTNVTYLAVNDVVQISCNDAPHRNSELFENFTLREAFEFVQFEDFEHIAFMLDAAKVNEELSAEGKRQKYGMSVGRTFSEAISQGMLQDDLLSRIVVDATCASDARMGGAALPAMTNFGSGNQGIVATMPMVTVARYLKASLDDLARALTLSHLVAISIHARYTRLSALCAASTAAMGAAAGMSWLFTRDFGTIGRAISNMVSDVSGIICDGASNSCAMKVSTAVTSAFKAVLLARNGIRASTSDGIVCDDVEETINNLCLLVTRPMTHTDKAIIRIMSAKR
ncbi:MULTISPECIES: L-cysteine desulfidase family protein [Burkholderia]|uniref:L-cysteine desulfidase family protein n=1 Tax=Burkholderia TaxID=32008 RepID=UPI001E302E7C|nr:MULTISPECIES: L-serine ammonia-lyase, iron-sulfur-dependent, subunit alpha [unclassified Burkholderia]